jgi:hypothetical protein
MHIVIAWIVAFMTAHAPPGRPIFYPTAQETKEETVERYNAIATDIAAVVYDPNEQPLFKGDYGRSKAISIMQGIAFFESGFRKDVDTGVGKAARGDGGKSVCLMQIEVGTGRTAKYNMSKQRFAIPSDPKNEVEEGFTASELLSDRQKCLRVALHLIRQSFKSCGNLPLDQYLNVYTSGHCDEGIAESHLRMMTGVHWFEHHQPTFTDNEAMIALGLAAPELATNDSHGF